MTKASCPECKADEKYNYGELDGSHTTGFFCGAVINRYSATCPFSIRKMCDYRPPKGEIFTVPVLNEKGEIVAMTVTSEPLNDATKARIIEEWQKHHPEVNSDVI